MALQVEGKIDQIDFIPFEGKRGAFQDIGEFADISRPIIMD